MQTIPAKTIIQKSKLPPHQTWWGISYNMNLYNGCNHGCIYCDSRSLCYQNTEFDVKYGLRYVCNIPNQKTVIKSFKEHCEKLGLLYQFGEITNDYQKGYNFNPQMSIFDMAEMLRN